jgi:hypothetical protein
MALMSDDERSVNPSPLDAWKASTPSISPEFVPTASQEYYIAGTASGPAGEMRIMILEGPRGEGKTASGLMACVALADRIDREGRKWALPLRVACVRDTFINLQRTTLVSIEEMRRKGVKMAWHDGKRECVLLDNDGLRPMVHIYFFGLDRQADSDKLQGFVCGVLWLEEVAPAAGLDTGVPEEVFALGGSCLRQSGVSWQRILVTMNSPDQDHWICKVEERLEELGMASMSVTRVLIPQGEKSSHFRALAIETAADQSTSDAWSESAREFDLYRERNKQLLESIGRHDLVARLVEGRRGGVQVGEPVVPNFSQEHISTETLPVFKFLPIIRGWDQEPNPACVIMQILPENRGVNVLGSHVMENATMEQLIRGWLLPWLGKNGLLMRGAQPTSWGRGPKGGLVFEDIGDPVFLNQQLTAGQVLMQLLGTSLQPGPVGWEERRASALACFERSAKGGRRFMMIEKGENRDLISGLEGRFRYPKDQSTGRIIMTAEAAKRVSGRWSNTCDALFYALAVKYPAAEWLRAGMRRSAPPPREAGPGTFMGV